METGTETNFYLSKELLEIFKEQHRLCSPLDPMADEQIVLSRETKIYEWRDANDLLPWKELAEFLNQEFRLNISLDEWKPVLTPDHRKTLGDVCDFLSTKAKKEVVEPVKRLGAECLSAAIFLSLKRNLKNKGVDVSDLRPSSLVEPFLEKNFSPLMEEVTLTGTKTFVQLEYRQIETESRLKHWMDKIFLNGIYKGPVSTGDIRTFRDLVERIVEGKKLG